MKTLLERAAGLCAAALTLAVSFMALANVILST